MFTRARHRFISWARWVEFTTFIPTSSRSILILSSSPQACQLKLCARFILAAFLTVFDEDYKLWSSLLWDFLQPPPTSFVTCRNIPLSTLVSDTLNLCSFFNLKDKVSPPCTTKTNGRKIAYLCSQINKERCSDYYLRCHLFQKEKFSFTMCKGMSKCFS